MATIVKPLTTNTAAPNLRSFEPRRDLETVADLIELGFSDTLDEEGRRYLSQMRAAANSYKGLSWLGAASFTNLTMSGFVWEEGGRVVGNLSLIPYLMGARRHYLIANVVVHPDYRRQGIGRALTRHAIEHTRNAGAPATWLHVREENNTAIMLYESLGFIERARRTTWHADDGSPLGGSLHSELQPDLAVMHRQPRHWPLQKSWLQANYPKILLWSLPLNLNSLRPGLLGVLTRAFSDAYLGQWGVERRGQLAGTVTWQTTHNQANILWLAAPDIADPVAVQALLQVARRNVPTRRMLVMDYPAGKAVEPIEAAGFKKHQTLIWMENRF